MATDIQPIDLAHEQVACDICSSRECRVKFRVDLTPKALSTFWTNGVERKIRGDEIVVACRRCGLVYVNPRVSPGKDFMFYTPAQEERYFAETESARRKAYRQVLIRMAGWCSGRPGTLLDVGCGDGVLVEEARQMGINGFGLEISETLIPRLRQRLGDSAILNGDLSTIAENSFDVVTSINVLEHLRSPSMMLGEISRILRPGGILLVHVPNYGGLPARIMGKRWRPMEPLAHFYYFKARTLGNMLGKFDLKVIGRFHLIVGQGWAAALQSVLHNLKLFIDNGLGLVARKPWAIPEKREAGHRRIGSS